jgi:hypothetical protein
VREGGRAGEVKREVKREGGREGGREGEREGGREGGRDREVKRLWQLCLCSNRALLRYTYRYTNTEEELDYTYRYTNSVCVVIELFFGIHIGILIPKKSSIMHIGILIASV